MARVLLDVTLDKDEELATVAQRLTHDLDVTWLDTGRRSGGGWPEVEFTGPREDLEELLVDYLSLTVSRDEFAQLMDLLATIQE